MAERVVHFSDISGDMMTQPDQILEMVVLQHPDLDQGVKLEAAVTEVTTEQLGKLAIQPVICEVTMPGEEEPTRYYMTPTNFNKLAAPGRPMKEVLAEATPFTPEKKKLGNLALNGEPKRDHNVFGGAGFRHKGRTSPEEAQIVREKLAEVNAYLAAAGERPIDPANPEHARRYGFDQVAAPATEAETPPPEAGAQDA